MQVVCAYNTYTHKLLNPICSTFFYWNYNIVGGDRLRDWGIWLSKSQSTDVLMFCYFQFFRQLKLVCY